MARTFRNVLLGVLLGASCAWTFGADPIVTEVIDGDSVRLADGRQVRLIGVDTPEYEDRERNLRNAERFGIDPREYAGYAEKSEAFLKQLVEGKEVRTEIDPINDILSHHDPHGRFLAYLYVDGVFVNAEIIRQGYGLTYRKFRFRHRDQFLALEKEARKEKRGFWAVRA